MKCDTRGVMLRGDAELGEVFGENLVRGSKAEAASWCVVKALGEQV